MSPEDFLTHAKTEQQKWIDPVGRLILAAASIERSVNEVLEILSPENRETWRLEEFSKRVERISDVAKESLSDTLEKELKNQKRKYWPVMANRNAIAHNPLFMRAFTFEDTFNFQAAILHQQKNEEYRLEDVQKFADEADKIAADFMMFAMGFSKMIDDELRFAQALLVGMHLQIKE